MPGGAQGRSGGVTAAGRQPHPYGPVRSPLGAPALTPPLSLCLSLAGAPAPCPAATPLHPLIPLVAPLQFAAWLGAFAGFQDAWKVRGNGALGGGAGARAVGDLRVAGCVHQGDCQRNSVGAA